MSELVSVIVPMYNHAQFIEQCLDSVYNESCPNIELIVIDDGSKDNSLEVAQKWREPHPGKFHRFQLETQANQGICKTLNRLVALSKGAYIVILASDDYLLDGGIKAKIDALAKNPQWLAVCGDAILVDPEGNVFSNSAIDYYKVSRNALKIPRLFVKELVMRWSVPLQIMMFRREAFDPVLGVGNYDEDLLYEDRDMSLRLLSRSAYGFVDFPCYAYRDGFNRDYAHLRMQSIELCNKHAKSLSGVSQLYLNCLYTAYSSKTNRVYHYIFRIIAKLLKQYHILESSILS